MSIDDATVEVIEASSNDGDLEIAQEDIEAANTEAESVAPANSDSETDQSDTSETAQADEESTS